MQLGNKTVLVLLSLFLFGCLEKDYFVPSFERNTSLSKIRYPKEIINEKDFSIMYHVSNTWKLEYSTKMFCLKNNVWEKIEKKGGISEIDTIYSETEMDFIFKEIYLKKECRKEEADFFLNQLIAYGLFELEEEEKLLDRCMEQEGYSRTPNYTDIPFVYFYIIHGSKVRELKYQLFNREKDCPKINEWEKVHNIVRLFENQWYVKKH